MSVRFNEETHTYTLEDKKLISVTQLLTLAEITPDYSTVDPAILKAKCEYGTAIHKELEEFINEGKIGNSKELHNFIEYIDKNDLQPLFSEHIVNDDDIAGCIDCVLKDRKTGKGIIADFKTTSVIHEEACKWQLSLYSYLLKKTDDIDIDDIQVFHFLKNGDLEVVSYKKKSEQKINDLIWWYKNQCNTSFKEQQQEVIDKYQVQELARAEAIISELDRQKKEVENKTKAIKDAIIQAMKENGLKSFKNEHISISIVEGTTRKTLDSKKLQEEMPDVYKKYEKVSLVAESVRIKVLKMPDAEKPLFENNIEQR